MCCCGRRKRLLLEEQQRKRQQQQQQRRAQPKPEPRSPIVLNTSLASAAIESALRFPSPTTSSSHQGADEINAEVLARANISPPSYDSVMTEDKRSPRSPSHAAGQGSSQIRQIHAEPIMHASPSSSSANTRESHHKFSTSPPTMPADDDTMTVLSSAPGMYTPPTTRAPTVIFDHADASDASSLSSESTVDSVIEEFRRWESGQQPHQHQHPNDSGPAGGSSLGWTWAERKEIEKAERKAHKGRKKADEAARKAEKWAKRAISQGHVFEEGWTGEARVRA